MPSLNAQGHYAHGEMDAGACFDNAQFDVGGGFGWYDSTTIVYRHGLTTDPTSYLAGYHIEALTITEFSPKAPQVIYGSKFGHWAAWNPTDGIYSSPGVGATFPASHFLYALAPDGAIAFSNTAGLQVRKTNGEIFLLTTVTNPATVTLLNAEQAIWREGPLIKTHNLPTAKILGGVTSPIRAVVIGGEWWVAYNSTTHGGVLHKLTDTAGYLLPDSDQFDIEVLEGGTTVRYVYSSASNEAAGTMAYTDIDVSSTPVTIGVGVEVPGVDDDATATVDEHSGVVTLTNTVTFDVQPASEEVVTLPIEIWPSYPIGKGRGRIVHPILGAFDYEAKPDEWVNIDDDAIIPPIWASSRTLTSAANVLWNGNLRDVTVEERWKSLGGLAMPITQLRMLIAIWTTPVDPDVGYVEWHPSYITQRKFKVLPVNLSVGGQGIVFDDVINYKSFEDEPIGWVTAPVTFTMKIADRVET